MPVEFIDGAILTIEALFYEISTSSPTDVVLSLGINGIDEGDSLNLTPTLTRLGNSEQFITMNLDATPIVYKATWMWAIADSDLLEIGVIRGSQGALIDTLGADISILGFQVSYLN